MNPELVNPLSLQSKTKKKAIQTVQNHFESYLVKHDHALPELDSSSAVNFPAVTDLFTNKKDLITKDLVGKFFDYLKNVRGVKCGSTVESYQSTLRSKLLDVLGEDHALIFLSSRFEKINEEAISGGGIQTERCTSLDDHLKIITRTLFNAKELFQMNKSLICLQWQMLGRINEIAALTIDDLGAYMNGMV